MDEDAQLVALAQTGKVEAFGQLVSKYQDRLYTVLVRVTGSHDDARELTQDAFVRAMIKLETFQGSSSFYTWLYRIALNLSLSQRRRRRPVVSLETARERQGWEPEDGDRLPGEHLEQAERASQVRAALAELSDEHRTVLVLREIEGCDYETIAAILGLAIGTVRSRLHRARLELRDRLLNAWPEHPSRSIAREGTP